MDRQPDRGVRDASVRRGLKHTYAPSDCTAELRSRLMPGEEISVGGRVWSVGANELVLGDAFAQLAVRGPAFERVEAGDLLLVLGVLAEGGVEAARIAWRQAAPAPSGAGDVGRFALRGVGSALAARARIVRCVRDYFAAEGFVEVETPIRVPQPGVDVNVEAFSAEGGYLISSPELELKRSLVAGVPRPFQIARVSRRDEAGSLHEPEFTLLEWYRAFAGLAEVQRDTEQIVQAVAELTRGRAELALHDGRRIDVRAPFERVRVADAFHDFAGINDVSDLAASDESRYFELLVERVEPALARIDRALFLEAYPIAQAALARPEPSDPRFAERAELYVGGVELSNGYGELTDPVEQRRRFEAERDFRRNSGRRVYPLQERFLSALGEGMPPAGGNALGFDRLVMLALGAERIQDVIAFPFASLA